MNGKITACMLGVVFLMLGALGAQELPTNQTSDGFSQVQIDEFEFAWRIEGDEIVFRMSAPTQGWVAVGFKPEHRMRGADMSIGYVRGNEVVVEDHYGNRNTSHSIDERLGGTSDILSFDGEERDGRTTITVRRKLNSSDQYDATLRAGELTRIIFAWGGNRGDNTNSMHRRAGGFEIRL